ncbi:hypothetical protein PSTG_10127 [Puccinia striiformis f. sp. tritici PST-78]|uniref:Mid2 domain-containing protein n=1 Tax=Puccinia striiformis f. sp. tritici PST-78 TaxID=1165861 RepID=A0A0L0VBC6_9BASI|nr:hypothetical protein PSTG_10127 [Puccinia striiformis f. sp. tritici PST-78]
MNIRMAVHLSHPSLILNILLLLSLTTHLSHSQAVSSPSPSSPPAAAATAAPSSAPAAPASQPAIQPIISAPLDINPPSNTSPSVASPSSMPSPPNKDSPASAASNSAANHPASQSASSADAAGGSASSASVAHASSANAAQQPYSSIVIVTITRTGSDGSVYTAVTSAYTAVPRPSAAANNNNSNSGDSSSSTWAIIGGIVGGLAGIGAVVFIVFRCTQRRFSDLDDEDVAIKWPELVNRADDPSTLNPHAARPGVGHGIGEDDDQADEKPRLYSHDIAMEPLHSDQRHPGMYDTYQAYPPPPRAPPQEHNGYLDDPYLGPNGNQQPYPGTMNNLGYDDQQGGGGGYQHHPHDLQSQPSLGSSIHSPHNNLPPRPDSRQQQHLPPHLQQQQQQQQQFQQPPQQQFQQHHQHNMSVSSNQMQYPINWNAPDDIPLTAVNNNQQQQQQQSPGPHHPYHHQS